MGRAAFQIASKNPGAGADVLLQRTLLGYDILYLLRGAPVVYYGDEVGMIGSGGDQAARQDMFPTQVTDWRTQTRVGSPPIGGGSSFDVTASPIELELKRLAAAREANPALADGWTIVRHAKGPVLAVSRIDPVSRFEYLVLFNNGPAPATVTVPTATPQATWTPLFGGPALASDLSARVTVTVPAYGAVPLKAGSAIPSPPPGRPKLVVRADGLSNLWSATATVGGIAPVSVAFAVRRAGSAAWQRLSVDTSPPYRGFLDPMTFKKNERVLVAAIVRSLDGSSISSAVVPFRVRAR
jgi:hypothetical protein